MEHSKQPFLKRLLSVRGMGAALTAFAGLIIIYIAFGLINPTVFSGRNIVNLTRSMSKYLIIGIGQSYLLITGNIDLSIGSVVGMSCMISATLMTKGVNPWAAVVITFVCCIAVGVLNGQLVANCKLPPFIATLATMSILRGAAYLLLDNSQKFVDAPLRVIGNSKLFQLVPTPTVLMVIMTVIGILVLRYSRFGRYVLAVGGSKNSAVFSGLNVTRIRIGAYVICGVCAALGGIVYAGRIGSIAPNSCMGYEFTVITAVVLGGTKMSGGKSSIVGSALGCVFLYLIENAMTMLDISSYYQVFARAVMMLCAIAIDTATTMRNNASVIRERRARFLQIQ